MELLIGLTGTIAAGIVLLWGLAQIATFYACDHCRTWRIAHGHPPAGWVWTDRLRVCGECHRKAIGRRA